MEERHDEILYGGFAGLPDALGVRVDFIPETTSTNDIVRSGNYAHGDIVVAGAQTAGRGQRGNHWESEPGENLTFSLVAEPRFLPAGCQFLLSEAVSLAVADMLEEYGIDARIKWPNDIYIGGLKTAGILIENDIMGSNISRSIIGIGLNVNQRKFSDSLPNPTSMSIASGRRFGLAEVLTRFHKAFSKHYSSLESGYAEELENDYHERLYLLGIPHVFRLPGGAEFRGAIRRVEPSGELVVEHQDGNFRSFLFKEISF